jgi:hypothetical protein
MSVFKYHAFIFLDQPPPWRKEQDLRLDISTNGLNQVYKSPQAIYQKTYSLEIVHLKKIYKFVKKNFLCQTNTTPKNGILLNKIACLLKCSIYQVDLC